MMFQHSEFKSIFSEEKRFAESQMIRKSYPDRLPIICERGKFCSKSIPKLDKIKYLLPHDLTVGQFVYVIRKRMKVCPSQAIFLLTHNRIISNTETIDSVYRKYCDEGDNFLYFFYISENVFG